MDVYDHAVGHGRSRHAFDISDVHDEERVVVGGRRAKSRGTTVPAPSVSSAFSSGEEKRVHALQIQTKAPGIFRDGQSVLPGFKLADKPVAEDMW